MRTYRALAWLLLVAAGLTSACATARPPDAPPVRPTRAEAVTESLTEASRAAATTPNRSELGDGAVDDGAKEPTAKAPRAPKTPKATPATPAAPTGGPAPAPAPGDAARPKAPDASGATDGDDADDEGDEDQEDDDDAGATVPVPPLAPSGAQDAFQAAVAALPADGLRMVSMDLRAPETPVLCPRTGMEAYRASVVRVVDGDTVVLLHDGDERKLRLIGLNAPERGDELYDEATELLRRMIEGDDVIVIVHHDTNPTDRYGRELAYVFTIDGRLANAELIRHGLAYCYFFAPNRRYDKPLRALQQLARADRLGLWSLPAPEPVDVYLAGPRESRFHREDCRSLGAGKSKVFKRTGENPYEGRNKALDSGRNPCLDCEP